MIFAGLNNFNAYLYAYNSVGSANEIKIYKLAMLCVNKC